MDQVTQISSWLDKIQGWPAALLVWASCIVVGYCLKGIKRFPNGAIPLVVILWGALFMLFLADPRANNMPPRIWTGRNVLVGLLLGFLAWMMHKSVLWRVDKFVVNLIGSPPDQPEPNQQEPPPADQQEKGQK